MTDHEPSPREAADYLHAHPGEFLTIPSALRPHVHALMDHARAATHPAEDAPGEPVQAVRAILGRILRTYRCQKTERCARLVTGKSATLQELAVEIVEKVSGPAQWFAATHPAETECPTPHHHPLTHCPTCHGPRAATHPAEDEAPLGMRRATELLESLTPEQQRDATETVNSAAAHQAETPRDVTVCQVHRVGIERITCSSREDGGYRCEVTGPHNEHSVGEHTKAHTRIGNGYPCSAAQPAAAHPAETGFATCPDCGATVEVLDSIPTLAPVLDDHQRLGVLCSGSGTTVDRIARLASQPAAAPGPGRERELAAWLDEQIASAERDCDAVRLFPLSFRERASRVVALREVRDRLRPGGDQEEA